MTDNNESMHSLINMEGIGSRSKVLTPDKIKYFLMSLVLTVQKLTSSDQQQETSDNG